VVLVFRIYEIVYRIWPAYGHVITGNTYMTDTNPDLKYRFFWLLVGYALVALIVYLSLTSKQVIYMGLFKNQDKLYHAAAYFTLMFWFSQIYHRNVQRAQLIVAFVFLGILMEFLQGLTPHRDPDIADAMADIAGVLLGYVVTRWRLRFMLARFETIFS
jgi:VanZ family protein